MAARDPLDETVQTEATQIVGHRAGRIGLRISTLELCDVIAELPMAKAGGREGEQTERVHERVDPAVAEAEAGGALILHAHGCGDGVQAVFADEAVVAQRFDV